MSAATIILPHQLFEHHPALVKGQPVHLVELGYFFTRFLFHKHKLIFHYLSFDYYKNFLEEKGYRVFYHSYQEILTLKEFVLFCKKNNIEELHYCSFLEHDLMHEFEETCKQHGVLKIKYSSPAFMTSQEDLYSFFGVKKEKYLMQHFYQKQRIRCGILMNERGEPYGGKWSFDEKNRKKLPLGFSVSDYYCPRHTQKFRDIFDKVERLFPKNPGNCETFNWPVNYDQAKKTLSDFLENRFIYFGPYQDAISSKHTLLFHARLSPLLNSGLLLPDVVIREALGYAEKHSIPLESIEGFVRQIIGWREFIYGMYLFHGQEQLHGNYFNNTIFLGDSWWEGTVGVEPIDTIIKKVLHNAYAHHIERLMVIGNFMMISRIHPKSVYHWFMELFIDAYDWVMIPNVYGMSQYADGGLMATKPYISSSAYVQKMSDFPKGDWVELWDALFWTFIESNQALLNNEYRFAFMITLLKRMDSRKLKKYKKVAENYFERASQ